MTSSLHIVVDAAAPEMSELLLYARRVVCSKAASFEPGMLAMTAFGSTTTRNLLSEAGMAGYQGVHTLFELAPCCTAALDGLDALQALEGVESDIFDALVAAVYELHCKDKDGQRRREILVLCDAQRHADDDALEEDTAQLLKGIDDLGITISVVSTTPLPASGVLHTLFNSLGGGRFEFARLEGAGLHAQAGGIGPEPMERKEDDSKREAELEAEREVKKEAEPVEAKPDAREEAGGSQCGALVDSNDDKHVSVRTAVSNPHVERRVDPTDPGGGAFTRAEFIDFYGGTDEWDAAPSEKTVDLARCTLRAHLAWSQLDKERKILRSLAKNSADKGVREAMAAQFAHLGSTEAAVGGGGGGCDDEGDEGDGGGGGDAFADWDLRPGLGAPAPGPLPKGAAFLVTGALAPSDHAKARAHAAVAHATAAADRKSVV